MNVKKSLKDVVVLLAICIVFGAALSGVYSFVGPIIEEREAAKATGAYGEVIPNSTGFETVNREEYPEISPMIKEILREKSGLGYAFNIETNAYNPGFKIIVGVSADGIVTGVKVIGHSETDGIGTTVINQYPEIVTGTDINTIDNVDIVGGATYTSKAYKSAVKEALKAVVLMGGGEVDNRTEEEIFEDNLEAAVGDENADFKNVYVVDNNGNIYTYDDLKVTGIYEATNGKGYVFVIDKEFVGVDTEGKIIGETSENNSKNITDAMAIINSTNYIDVDTTEYKNSADRETKTAFKYINSVKKTEAGVYVVDLTVQGYKSAPTPMNIVVTVGTDGTIVDFAVVSHSETASEPYGGAKIESDYYNDYFIGKNQTECKDVDFNTIKNGATETSNGVKKAMNYSFVAVNAIENAEGGTTNE